MKKLQEGAHFHSSSDMNADMSTEAADMVVLAVDKYIPTQNWAVGFWFCGARCLCCARARAVRAVRLGGFFGGRLKPPRWGGGVIVLLCRLLQRTRADEPMAAAATLVPPPRASPLCRFPCGPEHFPLSGPPPHTHPLLVHLTPPSFSIPVPIHPHRLRAASLKRQWTGDLARRGMWQWARGLGSK